VSPPLGPVASTRRALQLLWPRDRRRFGLAVALQAATSLLDLLGVILIGIVAYLALNALGAAPLPARITDITQALGLGSLTTAQLALAAAGLAAALLLTKSLVALALTRRTLRFLARRQGRVASDLTARLFAQSLTTVQERSSVDVAYSLTAGASAATVGLLGAAAIVLSELIMMVLLVALLAVVDPLLTVAMIVYFFVIGFVLQRLMGRWAGRVGARGVQAGVTSSVAVQEGLASFRELATSGRRGVYRDRVNAGLWEGATARADGLFIQQVPKYVLESALVIGALLLAGTQLLGGSTESAVATLAVFITAALRIMPSILRLQGGLLSITWAAGEARGVFELDAALPRMEAVSPSTDEHSGATLASWIEKGFDDFTADVKVERLTFAYPGASEPALDNLSFEVAPGTSLAIVGSTGAGKSTLADVLLGLVDPSGGLIRIGGLPPHDAVHRWPGGIAYVPQAVGLLNADVRRNVALGIPDQLIDDDRVWEALDRARLGEFVRSQREALAGLIGERGTRLSGGQRQRLGLARALYSNPQLVVLDEATSALDALTEQEITDALRDLTGRVTLITIAHRLATVRDADQVAYLEDGRLIALGSFDDVRESVPAFDAQAQLLGLA
jgi:ABC-type multidrug transport system fused ATPase/permease subunit